MVVLVVDEHSGMTVHSDNLDNCDIEVSVRVHNRLPTDRLVGQQDGMELEQNRMNMELLGRSGNSQPEIDFIIIIIIFVSSIILNRCVIGSN